MPDAANPIAAQFNLSGKVAVVTGATRGIGQAIAKGLADCGARVVITGRKPEATEQAARECSSTGQVTGFAAHMGDLAAIKTLVDKTLELHGGIDIIVNNAATNPIFGPLLQNDMSAFDKIIDVNVKGPLELARLAHPSMKQRGGGSIINISSIGGIRPEPGLGLYSMSKAALISLTKVMAQEWGGDNIRANAICPGLIKTKFSAALWQNEKVMEKMNQHLPLHRIGEPEDIATLAVYLASPASSFCTGALFTADGGHTI